MKANLRQKWIWLGLLSILVIVFELAGQRLPGDYSLHLEMHESLEGRFKTGDTNVPLLIMTCFDRSGAYTCEVIKSGAVRSSSAGLGVSLTTNKGPLNSTNISNLIQLTIKLPASLEKLPLDKQQFLVGAIRSNQWFRAVYDRTNVPDEVLKLYEIAGGIPYGRTDMKRLIESKPQN